MTLDHSYFEEMEAKIPHGKIRTRFAPSPTGYMHVGNLRTALYTWLIARTPRRHVYPADRGHRPEPSGGGRCGCHLPHHGRVRPDP